MCFWSCFLCCPGPEREGVFSTVPSNITIGISGIIMLKQQQSEVYKINTKYQWNRLFYRWSHAISFTIFHYLTVSRMKWGWFSSLIIVHRYRCELHRVLRCDCNWRSWMLGCCLCCGISAYFISPPDLLADVILARVQALISNNLHPCSCLVFSSQSWSLGTNNPYSLIYWINSYTKDYCEYILFFLLVFIYFKFLLVVGCVLS